MRYKAFMSYSHEADRELAATLESALHRIGIPWYRRPQLYVFRDETILPTTADLWKTIEGVLKESENLLLLASPQAAASPWVQEEITYWLQHRPLATLHIILTAGTIEWDDATADFDWEKTTALPTALRRVFPEPPKYLDLRWAKGKRYLSPRNPEFLYAVAEVAAPLLNTTKDQLVWRERNQYRNTVVLASAAAVLLLLLGIRAFWFQRVAEHNHQVALARQLMTQAETLRTQRPDQWQVSTLLALEAVTRFPSPETDQALHHGSALLPCATARGGVTTIAFRPPQGEQIVTTGYNCLAHVWEVTTGTLIASLPHEQGIQTAAFSPDSVSLATLSYNSTVRLWDGHTYQRRVLEKQDTVEHEPRVSALTFSPDGRYLATASYENRTCLWHVITGQKLRCFPPHDNGVIAVTFSASGHYVATASYDNTARVWDVEHGTEIARMPHPSGVTTVLFSPDETHLATVSYDPIVRLWEIARCQQPACQEHLRLPHVGAVTALTFSQTGHYVATAGVDRVANVWDAITGQQLARFAHEDGVTSVAFDHTEHRLATGSYDRTARVWDLKSRHEIVRLSHNSGVTLVAFSPDDTRLATAGYDWVAHIWNPTTGQEVSRLPQEEEIAAVAFQADGQVLVTANYESDIHIWKRAEEQPLTRHHEGGISALTLSADGHTLATAGWDKSVRVWNLTTGERIATVTHEHGIAALALNADGQTLAIAGWDGNVRVRNLQADTESTALKHGGGISALAVKDPYVLTAGWDHIVRVWNLTGKEHGHRALSPGITAVTFNGQGTQFATASDDNTVRVWDVATMKEIEQFSLDAAATAVAFSNTGNCLATASWNQTAQLWQISPKRELTRFHHQEGIAQIAFSAAGKQLITAGWDHVVLQWPWRREALLSQACTDLKTQSLTMAQWNQYMGDEEPRDTCSALQTLRVVEQPPC